MLQMPLKMTLISKEYKSDSKIITALCLSKAMTHVIFFILGGTPEKFSRHIAHWLRKTVLVKNFSVV